MSILITNASLLSKYAILRQDQIDSLMKEHKLTKEQVLKCDSYDPSPGSSYTGWLCKVYKDTPGTDDAKETFISKLRPALIKFMKLCKSPDFPKEQKNLGKYTVPQLLNLAGSDRRYLKNLSPKDLENIIKRDGLPGAKIIWNGGGFRMWYITNPDYARILAEGTAWFIPEDSESFAQSGGCYIIYQSGKPFVFGRANFTGDGGGQIEFCGTDDRRRMVDPFNSDIIKAFTTIKHPIMEIFKRKCDGNFQRRLGDMTEEEIQQKKNDIIDYIDLSRHMSLVKSAVCFLWWEEGWEMLLDSPTYLMSALEICPLNFKEELRDSSLSSDVADICNDKKNIQLALFFGGDLALKAYIHNSFMDNSGDPSILKNRNFTEEQKEFLDREGVREVASLTSEINIANENRLHYIGINTLEAYWKKFKNQRWEQFDTYLSQRSEEYTKRKEELQPIMKKLRNINEGENVIPGPDCKTPFKKGVITKIEREAGDTYPSSIKFTLEIKEDKTGKIFTLVQDEGRGIFQVMRAEKDDPYVPMINPPSKLKIGDIVIPGYAMTSSEYEYGDILQVDGEDCKVSWDNGDVNWQSVDCRYVVLSVPSSSPEAITNWEPDTEDPEIKIGDTFGAPDRTSVRSGPLTQTAFKATGVDSDVIWSDNRSFFKDRVIKYKKKIIKGTPVVPQPIKLEAGMRVIPNPDTWIFRDQWRGRGPNPPSEGELVIGEVVRKLDFHGDTSEPNEETTYLVSWPNTDSSEAYNGAWDYRRKYLIVVA